MKNIIIRGWLTITLVGLVTATALGEIEGLSGNAKVADIVFEGLTIIDDNYVLSLLSIAQGDRITNSKISSNISKIYREGFADDIIVKAEKIKNDEYRLYFVIKEKPRINKITFIGNKSISDSNLAAVMKSTAYSLLKSEVITQDVKSIIGKYKSSKFYAVKVFHEITPHSKSSVDIRFNIIENPKIYLTQINIRGSEHFHPLSLKRLLMSQKIDCFSWMTSTGVLDENIINFDLRTIYQQYANDGYIRLQIHRPRIRIFQNRGVSKAVVDIYLEEGDQYRVNKIDINTVFGETLLVNKKEIIDKFALKEGDIFDQSKFLNDRGLIDNFYQDRGYAYNKLKIDTPINNKAKTIDIVYQVEHKEKVYINRVNIVGNHGTKDYVVRREMSFHDQQLFRSSKVQSSYRNLSQLGFFDSQSGIQFVRQENYDKTIDYNVTLKEALTGSVNFSLSYSQINGLGVGAKVQKRNFLGKGQTLSATANYLGDNDYSLEGSFTEPYFLGTDVISSSSINVSQYSSKNSEGVKNYDSQSIILGQSFGQSIWKDWRLFPHIFFKWNQYRNITDEGLDVINYYPSANERGFGFEIRHSTVNHPVFSSSGTSTSIAYDFIGTLIGGSTRYNRFKVKLQYFKSINQAGTIVFMARYRYNRLIQVDNDHIIPPNARYAIGGPTTLRGFTYGSINGASSPAERAEDFNALTLKKDDPDLYRYYRLHENGMIMSLANFELLFPISADSSYVRGVIFIDMGNVWSEPDIYQITGAKLDHNYYKKSYGGGVRIITPAGIIRLEYGNVIDPLPKETAGKLEFFVGSLF
ncbi:MAG: outer membrane protein assembly factor BamA [SAR324 cluster bacterium]|nr:outer membrane protein assembly factor BamA [SAR324 cluster bacterium]